MSLTVRSAGSVSTGIQMRSNVNKFFDGTVPAATGAALDSPLTNYNIYKYPSADNGGLIFWNHNEPIVCGQLHVAYLGGDSGNITVNLVNLDPNSADPTQPTILNGEVLLIESASAVQFISLDESKFKVLIFPGQALQVITAASVHGQILQAVASLERTYQR